MRVGEWRFATTDQERVLVASEEKSSPTGHKPARSWEKQGFSYPRSRKLQGLAVDHGWSKEGA